MYRARINNAALLNAENNNNNGNFILTFYVYTIINLTNYNNNNNNNGNFIKCFRVHTIIVNLTYSKVIYKLLLESLIIYTK